MSSWRHTVINPTVSSCPESNQIFSSLLSPDWENLRCAPVIPRVNTVNHAIWCFACPEKAVPIRPESILPTFNTALLKWYLFFLIREIMMHFFDLLRCFQSKLYVGNCQTYEAASNLLYNYFSHWCILIGDFSHHDKSQGLRNMLMTLKSLKVHGFQRSVKRQHFKMRNRGKSQVGSN